MKTEAIVTFEHPFQFPQKGGFATATEVRLRAPGLGKRHVHTTLQAFLGEAIGTLQNRRAEMMARAAQQPVASAEPTPTSGDKDEDPLGYWMIMTMGLSEHSLTRLADYLMKELSGSPRLATIGDTDEPLTESAWESIIDGNGMVSLDRIFGTYVGFFMGSQKSPTANGSGTSTISSLPPKAASRGSMRSNSRSAS